jgi:hypothetical protein
MGILHTVLLEGKSVVNDVDLPLGEHPDDIPVYTGPIIRLATTEPIADPIGDMLRAAQRPTPLERVAEFIFTQVLTATGDLFAAWEAMSQAWLAGADKLDEVQALVEAEEPVAFELPVQYFEDEVTL